MFCFAKTDIHLYCNLVNHSIDIVKVYIFNPENDLALADGTWAYSAPPAAMRIANDLSTLPLWYADSEDFVFLPYAKQCEYYNEVSGFFCLAKPYTKERFDKVDKVSPWGWSLQLHRRLRNLGMSKEGMLTERELDSVRGLSNRITSIKILDHLKGNGIDTPHIPEYYSNPDDVAAFVNGHDRCVIKAPWSGSGKGIMWGKGKVERPLEQFYKGVMRRQGGVVCEKFLNVVVEFAMEFWYTGKEVVFAGYSLFTTSNASYNGNILVPDKEIEQFVSQYIPLAELHAARKSLLDILNELLAGSGYEGYLGIDMVVYDDGGRFRLNPCMELNLRMNMGMVSRLFYDKYVVSGSAGCYNVSYFKNSGEALALHERLKREKPLLLKESQIYSGYINLSPVDTETSYMAYAIIEPGGVVEELYENR